MSEQKIVIPVEEVSMIKTKIEAMRDMVSAIKVTTQEELASIAGHIGDIKKMKKFVTQKRDEYIAPAKEIIALAKDNYDKYINACDEAEALMKEKARVFMVAEQKKLDEDKAREIAKVESGYQKPETAIKKIEAMPEQKKTVDAGESKLTMKTVKDYRIVDWKLIPEEYYKPRELDLVKIRKVALAGVAIAGVELFETQQMMSKA